MPERDRTFIEEARRRQIVDAAIDTIAEAGLANASFAKIAARAGISPSLISYHFTSKAELMRAVAVTIDDDLRASVEGGLEGAGSYLATARAIAIGFVRYVDRNRSRMLALRQLDAGLSADERADIGTLDEESGISGWQQLLEGGQEAGEFRSFDPRVMATSIQGVLGAVPRELFRNPTLHVERLADEVATTIEHAISRRSA